MDLGTYDVHITLFLDIHTFKPLPTPSVNPSTYTMTGMKQSRLVPRAVSQTAGIESIIPVPGKYLTIAANVRTSKYLHVLQALTRYTMKFRSCRRGWLQPVQNTCSNWRSPMPSGNRSPNSLHLQQTTAG